MKGFLFCSFGQLIFNIKETEQLLGMTRDCLSSLTFNSLSSCLGFFSNKGVCQRHKHGTKKLVERNPPSLTFFGSKWIHFLLSPPYLIAFQNFRLPEYIKAMTANLGHSVPPLWHRPVTQQAIFQCHQTHGRPTRAVVVGDLMMENRVLHWAVVGHPIIGSLWTWANGELVEHRRRAQLCYHFPYHPFSKLTPFLSPPFSFCKLTLSGLTSWVSTKCCPEMNATACLLPHDAPAPVGDTVPWNPCKREPLFLRVPPILQAGLYSLDERVHLSLYLISTSWWSAWNFRCSRPF